MNIISKSAISISKCAAFGCISVLFLLGNLPAQTNDEQGTSVTEASKVRIVRLSEVKGAVQLDRNAGSGFEAVLANLPIVEKNRLQTGMGVAEVEFEDNSTLRIAPGSIVEFIELDRQPDGKTVSSVRLVKGTAYVSLLKTSSSKIKGNEFNILFGERKLQLPPSSHIRLQLDATQATLAVFDGAVNIDGPEGPGYVSRKNTLTFQLKDQAAPEVAKNVVPEALDQWDKDAAQRHSQTVNSSAFNSPYSYGLGDMAYYGSFMNVGGCGQMWRPYFASAAWDPYANGVWAWYQGAGYSWVSPYPWGWTPFHTGSWSYCSGAGWGWQPGGSWNGLNNTAGFVTRGGVGGPSTGGGLSNGGGGGQPVAIRPIQPIHPPNPGGPSLTAMNMKSLVHSEVSADSFVFRKDSAGMGVPREGLGKLEKLSQSAVSRGTATTPIYFSSPASAAGGGRPGNPEVNGRPANANGVGRPGNEPMAVTSIHRGSAPAADPQMPSQAGVWNGGAANAARSGQQAASQQGRPVAQPNNQQAPQPSSQSNSQTSGGQASPAGGPARANSH